MDAPWASSFATTSRRLAALQKSARACVELFATSTKPSTPPIRGAVSQEKERRAERDLSQKN